MSMSRRKAEDEIWFVHAPLKNERREPVPTVQPSNIPYLNGVMDTEEEMNKKQIIWFKDTDSDFVRLSKLGGRHDLLIHRNKERSQEPKPYPIPSWWTDMLTEVVREKQEETEPYVFEVPAWFAHQDKTHEKHSNNWDHRPDPVVKQTMAKHETIEEPRKYGQLRNYLNPAKVKKSSKDTQNEYTAFRQNNVESAATMPKLLANHYQTSRPKDYEQWKSQNLEK